MARHGWWYQVNCGYNDNWRSWEPLYRPGVKHAHIIEKIEKAAFPHSVQFVFVGWTTDAKVAEYLSAPPMSEEDRLFMSTCVDAANRAVARWRPDLAVPILWWSVGAFSPDFHRAFLGGSGEIVGEDPMIVLGTTMLAARWFQRRDRDVAQFGEFGPLPIIDRDLEHILRLNRAAGPVTA